MVPLPSDSTYVLDTSRLPHEAYEVQIVVKTERDLVGKRFRGDFPGLGSNNTNVGALLTRFNSRESIIPKPNSTGFVLV